MTNGDKVFLLSKLNLAYIPSVMSLLQPSAKVPLELIEVQSGNISGQDDIIRLRSTYGRTAS